MSDIIVRCEKLVKQYKNGNKLINVIDDVNIEITRGQIVAIVGASGSGKSTLIHLLGGLDKPTSGICMVEGIDWQLMKPSKRDEWRNKNLGTIYQQHNLLPELTSMENVALPLWVRGVKIEEALERAKVILTTLKMHHRLTSLPSTLSGGERQRVAIARAIITNPKCILADEPTGSLDSNMTFEIFSLLCELKQNLGTTIIIATHDERLSKNADRIIEINDGKVKKSWF